MLKREGRVECGEGRESGVWRGKGERRYGKGRESGGV